MGRGVRTAGVAVAGLTGMAMRLAVAGGGPDAVAEFAGRAGGDAAELACLAGPPVSAAELLGRAEALYRATDLAELDYAQRMAAAGLLREAADQLSVRPMTGS